MSDSDAVAALNERNAAIIEQLRAKGGTLDAGPFAFAPMVVLHTRGRSSGREVLNPMIYLEHDGRVFVFASKGGAPTDPDWYKNLVANPEVTVERDGRSYVARAVPVEGAERERIYAIQGELRPTFAEYQQHTTRTIPVVELVPAT